jgi:hypothetical protein
LTRGKKITQFPKKMAKGGCLKHREAQNLWLRLSNYENSVLLFSRVKEVDFTNNWAERDLRD